MNIWGSRTLREENGTGYNTKILLWNDNVHLIDA